MNLKGNKYYTIKRDTDMSLYREIKNDVKYYNFEIATINKIFDKYENLIDENTYYIIGNYFLFTFDNIKYKYRLSNFIDEENYVNDIINELNNLGCKNVIYLYGELD